MSLFPEAQVRRRQPEQFNTDHSVFLCDQRSLSFTTEAVSSPYLLFTSLSQDLGPFTTRQSSTPAGQAGAAGGASRETLQRGLIAMRWRSEARFYHTLPTASFYRTSSSLMVEEVNTCTSAFPFPFPFQCGCSESHLLQPPPAQPQHVLTQLSGSFHSPASFHRTHSSRAPLRAPTPPTHP